MKKVPKVIQYVVFLLVFLLLSIILYWSMEWFSTSLGSSLPHATGSQTSLQKNFEANASGFVLPSQSSQAVAQPPADPVKVPVQLPPKAPEVFTAKAFISVRIHDQQASMLKAKNEDQQLPVASLVKLMTALVSLENYDLNQQVTISKQAMAQEGEQGQLQEGQVFTVKDLLSMTLIESSNRAADALSEVMGTDHFIDVMNQKAVQLDLSHTHFQDATGLGLNSYSSAKDISSLSQYLFERYPFFVQLIETKQMSVYFPDGKLHHVLVNTNQLLGQYDITGGKTGYTDEAKGCMMVIQQKPGQSDYDISVVLGSDNRFKDVKKILPSN